jgi:hypothetical protein
VNQPPPRRREAPRPGRRLEVDPIRPDDREAGDVGRLTDRQDHGLERQVEPPSQGLHDGRLSNSRGPPGDRRQAEPPTRSRREQHDVQGSRHESSSHTSTTIILSRNVVTEIEKSRFGSFQTLVVEPAPPPGTTI